MQFLLLHGGWQGGWCWEGVVTELERRGHKALAPTLPGLESGATDRSGVGLSTLVAYASRLLVTRDLTDVVVVGHSGGGSVAQGLAEQASERLRLIAYMSARVLLNGECILDLGDQRLLDRESPPGARKLDAPQEAALPHRRRERRCRRRGRLA